MLFAKNVRAYSLFAWVVIRGFCQSHSTTSSFAYIWQSFAANPLLDQALGPRGHCKFVIPVSATFRLHLAGSGNENRIC